MAGKPSMAEFVLDMRAKGHEHIKKSLDIVQKGLDGNTGAAHALRQEYERWAKQKVGQRELDAITDHAKKSVSELKKLASAASGVKAGLGGFGSAIKGFNSALATANNVVGTLYHNLSQLWDFLLEGGRHADVGKKFDELGLSIEKLREATGGMVDDTALQAAANLGIEMGLTGAQIEVASKGLMGFLQAEGKTNEAADRLLMTIKGLAKGEGEGFEHLGITVGQATTKAEEMVGPISKLTPALQAQLKTAGALALVMERDLAPSIDSAGAEMERIETVVSNFIDTFRASISDALMDSGFLQALTNDFMPKIQAAFEAAKPAIEKLVEVLVRMFDAIGPAFLDQMLSLVNAFLALTPILEALTPLIRVVLLPLTVFAKVIGALSPLIELLGSALRVLVIPIDRLVQLVQHFGEKLSWLAGVAADKFGFIGDAIDATTSAFNVMADAIDKNNRKLEYNEALANPVITAEKNKAQAFSETTLAIEQQNIALAKLATEQTKYITYQEERTRKEKEHQDREEQRYKDDQKHHKANEKQAEEARRAAERYQAAIDDARASVSAMIVDAREMWKVLRGNLEKEDAQETARELQRWAKEMEGNLKFQRITDKINIESESDAVARHFHKVLKRTADKITSRSTFDEVTDAMAGFGNAVSDVDRLANSFENVNESFSSMVAGIQSGAPALSTMLTQIRDSTEAGEEGGKAFGSYLNAVAGGIGTVAKAAIKDQKAQAAVLAAVEFAMGAASIAKGIEGEYWQFAAAAQHFLAGGLFAAVASGAGGSNRAAGETKSKQSARDAQDRLRSNDPTLNPNAGTSRGQTTVTQYFFEGLISSDDAMRQLGKMAHDHNNKGGAPIIPRGSVGDNRQRGF